MANPEEHPNALIDLEPAGDFLDDDDLDTVAGGDAGMAQYPPYL